MRRLKKRIFNAVMFGQKRAELILYAVLWTIMYAVSAFSLYIGQDDLRSTGFEWSDLFSAWGLLTVFLVAFCIHNFFIAPQLVYRNRRWLYALLAIALLGAFTAYQVLVRPHRPDSPQPPERHAEKPLSDRPPKPVGEEDMMEMRGNMVPADGDMPNLGEDMAPPLMPEKRPEPEPNGKDKEPKEPPRAFGGQDSVAFIIVMLLMGVNIGTKIYFRSLDDSKRMKELERENLNRQLEYLKYQINPHFFMNTLNNIHALVDIDPGRAQSSIILLSRMMRYVLYEGNRTMAPLQKEIVFIANYVELMRIRYTDKVRISVSLPQDATTAIGSDTGSSLADIQVPSLLFTTFVENAFKHGVSYQQESFIEVSIGVDETAQQIVFTCNNSVKPTAEDRHGGVGLKNAVKRLQLLYGDTYELQTTVSGGEYRLSLKLPTKPLPLKEATQTNKANL